MDPITPPPAMSAEKLAERLANLTLALGVAFVEGSVEVIEGALPEAPLSTDRVIELLDDRLETDSRARAAFARDFSLAMESELRSVFGYEVGSLVWTRIGPPDESRPIVATAGRARETALSIHLPLAQYDATYREWRYRHARLIEAIATEGMESITAFRYAEKHEEARARLQTALRRLA